MSNACHLDIETFSEAPLKKCGHYRYAEHPSTEIMTTCYAFGGGPVHNRPAQHRSGSVSISSHSCPSA